MKGSRYNMSKKSARSKGYRTYKTEQKGFSKGELKTLIIAAVVLVLAIAAIIILPDAIEARHLIKVKDGALQGVRLLGSEETLPCELLLIAAGFSGCEPGVLQAFGVQLPAPAAERLAEDVFVTDNPKVFCAGDARRGASLVVWAIAEGRACAKQVDEFLMGYSNML